MTVVLVVSCRNAHIGDLAAIAIERISAFVTLILERSISLVHIQVVWSGIVRHQQIWLAIPVHVHKQSPEAVVSIGIVHSQLFADIRKASVSIVMKEMVLFALQAARAAHHRYRAVLTRRVADHLRPGSRVG